MPSPIPGLDVRELSNVDIPKSYVPPKVDPSTGGYAGRTPGPTVAPTAAPTTPTNPQPGWFKRTASALRNPTAEGVGRALGKVGRVAGPAVAGFAAGKELGTYQIDDPEVDSSVAGTMSALRQGNFGAAGRSLSKGALEATMDLGGMAASAVDAVNPFGSPAKEAYDRGLRNTFGGQLRINGQSAPLATAPTAAGPDPRLQNPGRGFGFDDPRRLGMDPARGSLRESRDLGPELASVPAQLPDNLREGVVFKTKDANGRTVYSGKNVSGDVQFVDGKGATLRAGGGSGTVPGAPAGSATGLRDAGQGVGMGMGAQTEPIRIGGALERSPEQQRADAVMDLGSIDERTRERGARILESLDRSDTARTNADASRFNARVGADAAMYGADRRLQGELAQAQATGLRYNMDQRVKATQMAIQAQAMQMAGGDTRKAAQLILQMGGDPSNLIQAATGFQGLDTKNNADAREYFSGMATMTDKDDKPYTNEALQNQLYDTAMRMTSGKWASMSAQERQALAPEVQAAVQAVGGMNRLRNNGLLQMIGWDPATPEISQLPELRGATFGRVGKVSGALTPSVSGGDFEIRTAKGDTYYIPADQASERVLRMLENNGATKRKE